MGENSAIAWTDHTFNPVWGCTKVSAGCKNCYAEAQARRFGFGWGPTEVRLFGAKHWNDPLRWNKAARAAGKRARVFCGSMCDVFEHRTGPVGPVLDEQRARLWKLIASTESLDWLLLTTRPENIGSSVVAPWSGDWPANVWLGCTVEDRAALPRTDVLRRIPARMRFVSCEPLLQDLGPVDLTGIDLMIAGCESGPKARPMEHEWAAGLWRQCLDADVRFFFKQAMVGGQLCHEPTLEGRAWRELPRLDAG
jgi:protein gp37